MLLTLAHIGTGRSGSAASLKASPNSTKRNATTPKACFDTLTRLYTDRIAPYHPCQSESFPTEPALMTWIAKQHARVPATVILLDSTGRLLSSTAFAEWLGTRRDQGTQHLVFAIGPHDGWTPKALTTARNTPNLLLSFGPMTLPHEMARLVLTEQIYRACTILANHPYHGGH